MTTAVEWLEAMYIVNGGLGEEEFEQAKEMEKDQIMGAYQADVPMCSDGDAEEYYNTIFNS
jgi:hypothetical protein